MARRQHWLLYVLAAILFQLARIIWTRLQKLKWFIDGTRTRIEQRRQAKFYNQCAQLLDIRLRHSMESLTLPPSDKYFITTHSRFVSPEYVLKDNVSIYALTNNEAVFIEVPEGVEEWRLSVNAFHKIAQFENAVRIVKIPLNAFNKLSRTLRKQSQPKIILGYSSARSGSTLMCSIFEKTECCVSFSEPGLIVDPFLVNKKCKDTKEEDKYKDILVSTVTMLCKPRSHAVKAYFLKMLTEMAWLDTNTVVETLKMHFTDVHFIYLYRNIPNVVNSIIKLQPELRYMKIVNLLLSVLGHNVRKKVKVLDFFEKEEQTRNSEIIDLLLKFLYHPQCLYLQFLIYVITKNHNVYLSIHQQKPGVVKSIKYEDLLSDPDATIRDVFSHCGLPSELVIEAKTALEHDSQANSVISRETLSKNKPRKPECVIKDALDRICKHYNVAGYYTDLRLP